MKVKPDVVTFTAIGLLVVIGGGVVYGFAHLIFTAIAAAFGK